MNIVRILYIYNGLGGIYEVYIHMFLAKRPSDTYRLPQHLAALWWDLGGDLLVRLVPCPGPHSLIYRAAAVNEH